MKNVIYVLLTLLLTTVTLPTQAGEAYVGDYTITWGKSYLDTDIEMLDGAIKINGCAILIDAKGHLTISEFNECSGFTAEKTTSSSYHTIGDVRGNGNIIINKVSGDTNITFE